MTDIEDPAAPPPWVRSDTAAAGPITDDERLVLKFLAALTDPDLDVLRGYLAPEAMYQNMPLPPAYGIDAVLATLGGLFGVLTVDRIDTFHLASRDGYVFTERVDHLTATPTGRSVALPVSGVLRVRAGKVTDWRDYFDLRAFELAVGLQLPGAPVAEPVGVPVGEPSGEPVGEPSGVPVGRPSGVPVGKLSGVPVGEPSGVPVGESTGVTSGESTGATSGEPRGVTSGEPVGLTSGGRVEVPR
ncbi:MAG TPA: limonene-1,2-epoxide hydrolase family protein [Pseudonocardia sp.]|nr:limonene-1,2-epoxide hydrolase family protein [Pseudonocardia sp.]